MRIRIGVAETRRIDLSVRHVPFSVALPERLAHVETELVGLLEQKSRGCGLTHDEWRLLGYGILTASLIAFVLVPILIHDRNFPKSAAEGIVGAIALAMFLLSKYMEHRKKSN